jgi:hypothetical protein
MRSFPRAGYLVVSYCRLYRYTYYNVQFLCYSILTTALLGEGFLRLLNIKDRHLARPILTNP